MTRPAKPHARKRLGHRAGLLCLVLACSGEREAIPAYDAAAGDPDAVATAAAHSPVRHLATVRDLKTPEAARWDPELGVWFVSNIDGWGGAKDNNGFISRLESDGTVDLLTFVAGGSNGVTLHAPKGMAIAGDTLWVADIDVVRGFNRRTGTVVANISVPGAKLLNDVALALDGIYITDTGVEISADGKVTHPGPDRVFRITARQPTTAVTFPGRSGPNGITWDSAGSRFLVVPYFDSTILTWAPGDSLAKPFGTGPGMMDGIEALGGGRFLVSAGADSSLNIIERDRITRLAGGLPNPGDIGFDQTSGRVAVPLVMENRLELFELSRKAQRSDSPE